MGHSLVSWSFPSSRLAVLVACVSLINADYMSATSLTQNEVPAVIALSKRDVAHPRNCPGGYALKRNSLYQTLLGRQYVVSTHDGQPVREPATMTTKQDMKNSLSAHRSGLMYQLLGLLHRQPVRSSHDNKQSW